MENKVEEMEGKIEKYLGVDIGELKSKIIEKVLCIEVDYFKSILFSTAPEICQSYF